MNASDFFERVEERQASECPYLARVYGQHVTPMTDPDEIAAAQVHQARIRDNDGIRALTFERRQRPAARGRDGRRRR